MIAADYPFLDIFWSMIIFFAWVIWIWMLIVILGDVFRRRDIGGWAKAAWTVFLIVVPFLAALIYLIAQHDGMAERSAKEFEMQQEAFDARVRQAAGTEGPATQIAEAKRLFDAGAIDANEFAELKRKALT